MYPLAKKEGNFLLMYPLFVFPYLRTLRAVFSETMCFYAGIGGMRALIDAPFRYKHSSFCSRRLGVSGPPLPENLWRHFSIDFLFKFALKTAIFGRSLAQLILATLLLYPFGVKEGPRGPRRRFLSDVPFGQFCLVTYPSGLWAPGASWAVFWAPGASWVGFWALLGAKYLRGDGAPSGQVIINTKF